MELQDLKDRELGGFRLLRRLGRGGMADVYLAEQTSLNRSVAVKVLRSDLVTDEVHRRRFEQEARAAAGLNHPNIVQVYLVGQDEGVHFIAQEYVQGMNLRDFLRRKGPLDVPIALHIMRQVAAALAAANDAGIVHRDIKPENIMVTRKGEAKITDFGLAQLAQHPDGTNLTQVGITMGTPTYMSPEQVNGEKLDQRSDIYSFGITCYHVLGGKPPYQGETALSVAVKHLNESPPPLAGTRQDLPAALCQIVHKMIAREKNDRYQSAHNVLNDLKLVSRALKDGSDPVTEINLSHFQPAIGRPGIWSQLIESCGRGRLLYFAGLWLAVGGLAAGAGWLLRSGDPLQTTPAKPKIGRRATAEDQYLSAVLLGDDEAAWSAVREYHHDENYGRLADAQLARIYLRTDRLDDAEAIFNRLAALGNEERTLKATGFAGQAVTHSLRGQYRMSNNIIGTYLRDMSNALTPEWRRLVYEAIQQNNRNVEQQMTRDLLDMFRVEDEELQPEAE